MNAGNTLRRTISTRTCTNQELPSLEDGEEEVEEVELEEEKNTKKPASVQHCKQLRADPWRWQVRGNHCE